MCGGSCSFWHRVHGSISVSAGVKEGESGISSKQCPFQKPVGCCYRMGEREKPVGLKLGFSLGQFLHGNNSSQNRQLL